MLVRAYSGTVFLQWGNDTVFRLGAFFAIPRLSSNRRRCSHWPNSGTPPPCPHHCLVVPVAIQKGTRVLISLWDSLMFGRVPGTLLFVLLLGWSLCCCSARYGSRWHTTGARAGIRACACLRVEPSTVKQHFTQSSDLDTRRLRRATHRWDLYIIK